MCPASSVFISCDFVGQKHLCYLVPARCQLFCARLEKTNEEKPDIILGSVTVIPAKDAAYLPVNRFRGRNFIIIFLTHYSLIRFYFRKLECQCYCDFGWKRISFVILRDISCRPNIIW